MSAPKVKKEIPPIELSINDRGANEKYEFPNNYIKTTKYTLYNFFFLNMFYQFHKVSNIFFFVNMVIALIPGVSPVFPATTIMPLVVVLGAAALRDGYEDYQRYKSDRRANGNPTKRVVRGTGEVQTCRSDELLVGDLIYLEKNVEIPVDAVVLSSSDKDGSCFVETSNLDGETNIKPKKARRIFHEAFASPQAASKIDGTIRCDGPSESLGAWQGTMTIGQLPFQSVDMDSLLLRGCSVKNIDWCIAVTVYTGVNTKLFKNLAQAPPKQSRLDRKLNRLIGIILLVQQTLILIVCGLNVGFLGTSSAKSFYLNPLLSEDNAGVWFIYTYFTYFILLSSMMPISLFVSLEFCKAFQALLMDWDLGMTGEINGMRNANARTSSLNEELSQVQYVFSDKTGTLTENQMRSAKFFAGGVAFDELARPHGMIRFIRDGKGDVNGVKGFLRLLLLNNTVIINTKQTQGGISITYDGSSPDEVALVNTALQNEYKLLSRTSDTMTVEVMGDRAIVDVLNVIPFDSDRKMMSVIIKERDGTVRMFTKGADSAVMARVVRPSHQQSDIISAQKFLDDCSIEGLRTLAVAERVFAPDAYSRWREQWDRAVLTVGDGRDAAMLAAALEAEKDLTFLGCTAIEDRLQDEVPETIHYLLRCGIVVWVLTGDKRETAVNIATTSRLLNPREDLIIHFDITKGDLRAQIRKGAADVAQAKARGQKSSFFIDGVNSLDAVLQNDEMYNEFRDLGLQVNSAVCCRVTPKQKAAVVLMFQSLGNTCLSVGDGANDVSMILEARVGIGIMGWEGSQAERSADYAIPRFRHLRRLLAVHGRYSLIRNSHLVQFSFYKNLVFSLAQVFYGFYCGFSGQTVFDSWSLIFYNMAFTALPPLVMGMFDYDIRDHILLKYPGLYRELRSPFAIRMSRVTSLVWILIAIIHAIVCYYFVLGSLFTDEIFASGKDAGLWGSSTTLCTVNLFVVLAQAAFTFLSWTVFHFLSILLSLASYLLFLFIYEAIPPSIAFGSYFGAARTSFGDINLYLNTLFVTAALIFPAVMIQVLRRTYAAIDMQQARIATEQFRQDLPFGDDRLLEKAPAPQVSYNNNNSNNNNNNQYSLNNDNNNNGNSNKYQQQEDSQALLLGNNNNNMNNNMNNRNQQQQQQLQQQQYPASPQTPAHMVDSLDMPIL